MICHGQKTVLIELHNNITGANFMITSTRLYIPVVTLSFNDNIKFLENIKQRFKRTISWNKYRSEITTQTKNNNWIILLIQHLEILIDCLYCHSKMVTMILEEILLIHITCH